MAGPADFTLNPLPGSVQWNTSLFTVTQVGAPYAMPDDVGQIFYGASGDLTGDGWPEIVISGWTYRGWDAVGTPPDMPISVISTSATGAQMLDAAGLLGVAGAPGTAIIRVADFNGDGRNDLFMAGHNESPFVTTQGTLYVQGAAGGFTAMPFGPKMAAHEGEVGDVNGDGLPDVVLSAYWAEKTFDPFIYTGNDGNWVQAQGDSSSTLILEVNQGGGVFKALPLAFDQTITELKANPQPWTALNWGSGSASAIADLDNDGRAEVIVADLLSSQDWTRGDTFIITDLRFDDTSAAGRLIKLPAPYFEDKPAYAGLQSLFGSELSHDIQVQAFDFDNDGLTDILVHSMVWVDAANPGAGVTQFLHNEGGLNFRDVTDEVLFNSWLGKSEGSHESVLMDVNGDGFIDIVNVGESYSATATKAFTNYTGDQNVSKPSSWSNEILINTGNGKFVAVMWDQFHELTLAQEAQFKALGTSTEPYAAQDNRYLPYMTPDGRLGFVTMQTANMAAPGQDYVSGTYFFDVQSDARIYTGPGGVDPALQGAPGFNEAYYLTEHPDVAALVESGAYASGLAHYLAVGRAQGLQGFAANARVEGSAGNDAIVLREGAEKAFGGAGNDTLEGGAGQDYLRGEEGNDVIHGGADFDDIHGNMGNDTESGGDGDDWVVGGKDNDLLNGDAGDDIVYGNLGDDWCDGGAGNDIVRGGKDNDMVLGQAGNDWLSGDKGDDTVTGGAGADIFHTFADAGLDRVTDFNFAEGDRVQLDPGTAYTVAQVGADVVITMDAAQMVLVGVQLSTLTGDWIFGS